MTYDEAKAILQGLDMLEANGSLRGGNTGYYVYLFRDHVIDLDGSFTIPQLEAIVVYVKGTTTDAK